MRVLILNQTFYPEVAATAQLMWDLAVHLERQGHQVVAITSRTIYGTEQHHEKPYEKIGNIEIHRVGGTAFGKKRLAGRMCDFLSFYAAAFFKMLWLPKADVILALTSPPLIALLGMLQRQMGRSCNGNRVRLVYHVMDLYPDAAIAMGVMRSGSLPERITSRITRRTLEASDAVIALGRDMADLLAQRYAFNGHTGRVHVIPPWSDGAALQPLGKQENPLACELGVQNTFNIVYSGNFGMAHDADTIIGAIERMREDAGVCWLFIGGGNRFKQVKDRAALSGWKHVRFLPYQDREKLAQSLNLADVHLVSQLPSFTGIVVPSKLYGIMAVGKPSVMVGPADAECSRVISESECGFVVPNGSVDQLVESLRRLQADPELRTTMGRRARQTFEREYDRPIACSRIERILREVVDR